MKKFIAHMVEQETGVPDNSDLYKKFDENVSEFQKMKLETAQNWGAFGSEDEKEKFYKTVENIGDILTDKRLSDEDYLQLMNKNYAAWNTERELSFAKPIHEHFGWTLIGVPLERAKYFLKNIPHEQKTKYLMSDGGKVLRDHYKILLRHPEQTEEGIIETMRDAHEMGHFAHDWNLQTHVLSRSADQNHLHMERMMKKRGMSVAEFNKIYPGSDSQAVMDELRRLREHAQIGAIFRESPFKTEEEARNFYRYNYDQEAE